MTYARPSMPTGTTSPGAGRRVQRRFDEDESGTRAPGLRARPDSRRRARRRDRRPSPPRSRDSLTVPGGVGPGRARDDGQRRRHAPAPGPAHPHDRRPARDRGRARRTDRGALGERGRIYQRYGYGLAAASLGIDGRTTEFALLDPSGDAVRTVPVTSAEMFAPGLRRAPGRPARLVERDDRWWSYRLHDGKSRRDGATALRAVVHEDPTASTATCSGGSRATGTRPARTAP